MMLFLLDRLERLTRFLERAQDHESAVLADPAAPRWRQVLAMRYLGWWH